MKPISDICPNCGKSHILPEEGPGYSKKQYEYWVKSFSPGIAHDFMPWEFDENTGHIIRNNGTSGTSGTSSGPSK